MKKLNWDKYRRMQCNIDKGICNKAVSQLLILHYSTLHTELVKADEDEGTFNDTFIKLTYHYSPEGDFVEQFRYYFRLLKGAYSRDSKALCISPLKEDKTAD